MEDGDEALEFEEGNEEEDQPERHYLTKKKTCNQRLEELATPPRRIFLALYNAHAYHFPEEKVEYLKDLLQRLYAMTPEETARYFAELRAAARKAASRKKLKMKLRKLLLERQKKKQRNKAYRLFRKLLKCGIKYAAENPVPPLISLRLRYLSDVVLEQLCFLREITVPDRSSPCIDDLGNFMISVADWMAIAIERLYYAAQSAMNEEEMRRREQFANDTTLQTDASVYYNNQYTLNETFAPIKATSTPKSSFDDTFAPKATSSPRNSKGDVFVPKASTRRGSLDRSKQNSKTKRN